MNSDALAFPRYDLPFYLAVETSSKGIGLITSSPQQSVKYQL